MVVFCTFCTVHAALLPMSSAGMAFDISLVWGALVCCFKGVNTRTASLNNCSRTGGIRPSVDGVGTWYDSAPVESAFATLKTKRVHHCVYRTRQDARADILSYIEAFYNRCRIHTSLGSVSPLTREQHYHQGAVVPQLIVHQPGRRWAPLGG